MPHNSMTFYVATVFIASIIPGPSMLLALTHGMQFGAKRTLASAMGNLTVTLIQAFISIAGLGAILLASETAFQIIRFAGAGYLIYMGLGILISDKMSMKPNNHNRNHNAASPGKMYVQAAIVTAGNPKAIVFFAAVFPQFINPDMAYLPQFCFLMGTGSCIAFGCFMLYAISGQKIVSLFSHAAAGKCINRIVGSTFIGTGIALATGNK